MAFDGVAELEVSQRQQDILRMFDVNGDSILGPSETDNFLESDYAARHIEDFDPSDGLSADEIMRAETFLANSSVIFQANAQTAVRTESVVEGRLEADAEGRDARFQGQIRSVRAVAERTMDQLYAIQARIAADIGRYDDYTYQPEYYQDLDRFRQDGVLSHDGSGVTFNYSDGSSSRFLISPEEWQRGPVATDGEDVIGHDLRQGTPEEGQERAEETARIQGELGEVETSELDADASTAEGSTGGHIYNDARRALDVGSGSIRQRLAEIDRQIVGTTDPERIRELVEQREELLEARERFRGVIQDLREGVVEDGERRPLTEDEIAASLQENGLTSEELERLGLDPQAVQERAEQIDQRMERVVSHYAQHNDISEAQARAELGERFDERMARREQAEDYVRVGYEDPMEAERALAEYRLRQRAEFEAAVERYTDMGIPLAQARAIAFGVTDAPEAERPRPEGYERMSRPEPEQPLMSRPTGAKGGDIEATSPRAAFSDVSAVPATPEAAEAEEAPTRSPHPEAEPELATDDMLVSENTQTASPAAQTLTA